MAIDILAIGAHPDDIELTCGATIAKLIRDGRQVALLDLTRGELGTRGTKEIRAQEAIEAAAALGIQGRRSLDIPDGNIEVSQENIRKVISVIRELRPSALLIPHSEERHPDHVHAHRLCKEAWYYAGLRNIRTTDAQGAQEHFRPDNYFEFMQWYEFVPSFIIDVTSTFDVKMNAVRAYASQFHDPESAAPATKLSTPGFLELIEVRGRYYGERIGVHYGEPFFSIAPVGVRGFSDLILDKG